jgi:hypothetical protein
LSHDLPPKAIIRPKNKSKTKHLKNMKKAALTIGLFSLVVVTTSFTAPEMKENTLNKNTYFEKSVDPRGGATGSQTRKVDAVMPTEQSVDINNSLDFTAVNQSLGLNKKQD